MKKCGGITLRISHASPPDDPEVIDSPKPPKTSNSSSELSLLLPLKQLQRLRPYFTVAGCLSLFSSMKFCTILSKQTELGSNSVPPPPPPSLLLNWADSPTIIGFSTAEILRTLGNGRSKRRLSRDLNTGLADSVRTCSLTVWTSISIGWIFIGKGMTQKKRTEKSLLPREISENKKG